MSLTIVTEKYSYQHGETVCGCVRLDSNSPRTMTSVIIKFEGKSMVNIEDKNGSRNKHRGQHLYFSFRNELVHGESRPSFDVQEWPFEFQIPLAVSPTSQFSPKIPWLGGNQPYALPPSFRFWSNNVSRETEWECEITYELVATASEGRRFKSNLVAKTHIDYCPGHQVRNVDPMMAQLSRQYLIKSLRLLPQRATGDLSVREKMRSAFKSSSIPSVDIHVTLDYPTCIQRRGHFPLRIATFMQATAFARPKLYLRRVNAFVNFEVKVRAPGLITNHTDSGEECQRMLEVKDLDIEIPTDGTPFDLSMFGIDTSRLQQNLSTSNVAVVSTLDLMVKLKAADKSFSISVKVPIQVLPAL